MSNYFLENEHCELCSGALATNGGDIWCVDCEAQYRRCSTNNGEYFELLYKE